MADGWTVGRRHLGAVLRELRRTSGKSAEDASKRLGRSVSTISRMETGQTPVRHLDVEALLTLYGVTDPLRVAEVMGLHERSQQEGWWAPYDEVLHPGMGTYADLESSAEALRSYEPVFVPGQAQSAEYARAVIEAEGRTEPAEIDRLVQFRVERTRLLTDVESSPQMYIVVEESVLRRPVGGPAVMRSQIERLADFAQLPHVDLRIIRADQGAHAAMAGGFALLSSAAPAWSVVYVDSIAGNLYLEKEPDITRFAQAHQLVHAQAASPQVTLTLLRRLAEEIGKKAQR